MPLQNTQSHYGIVSIVIHWLLAITLAGLFISGVVMTGLDYYDPLYTSLPWWHKSIGLLVFFLFIFKLFWLLLSIKPEPHPNHRIWEVRAASSTHFVLISLIGLISLTGYLITSAAGASVSFFDWFELPALFSVGEKLETWSGKWHWWLALGGAFVVALHVSGALKHAIFDRDGTLKRMIGK